MQYTTSNFSELLQRITLPGEVWRINGLEAHCIFTALARIAPFYNMTDLDLLDHNFLVWHQTLKTGPEKFIEITPADIDRVFLETLLKCERARLAECEPTTPCYDCGGTVYDHENAIRQWIEREIELPKRFVASRKAREELPLNKLNFEGIQLSRQDAERIIAQEIERLGNHLKKIAFFELARLDKNPPAGYERERAVSFLERAHEAARNDAEKQLWAILEKYIVD